MSQVSPDTPSYKLGHAQLQFITQMEMPMVSTSATMLFAAKHTPIDSWSDWLTEEEETRAFLLMILHIMQAPPRSRQLHYYKHFLG